MGTDSFKKYVNYGSALSVIEAWSDTRSTYSIKGYAGMFVDKQQELEAKRSGCLPELGYRKDFPKGRIRH